MKLFRGRTGFTLIELLVVILILAILMAIALPLYLRAVRDSQRQTCRSNMQTIANAAQAWKVRNTPTHAWPANYAELFTDPATGLAATGNVVDLIPPGPQCPSDGVAADDDDYTITAGTVAGTITISCNCDDAAELAFHNTVGADPTHGFTPGVDSQ
jgi:type IV pilus assembly protein PilA